MQYITDNFPGFGKFPYFLKQFVKGNKMQRVLDVGGGANPMLETGLVSRYDLLDIDDVEISKAEKSYDNSFCYDACGDMNEFINSEGGKYDLVFSHMCMEHLNDPLSAHYNIYRLLKRGGCAIHLYPSKNNLPLLVNSLVPEWLSFQLVRFFQPERDLEGSTGKFPAYYKLCGPASKKLHSNFESIGFTVVTHDSYTGHSYYKNIPIVNYLESKLRRLIVKLGIPIISLNVLILKKEGS